MMMLLMLLLVAGYSSQDIPDIERDAIVELAELLGVALEDDICSTTNLLVCKGGHVDNLYVNLLKRLKFEIC